MEKGVRGKFITFEGSEGSGKSTQIEWIRKYLLQKKKQVLFVREPGGVMISEKIRDLLLDVKNEGMSSSCEMLLYMAARAQLVEQEILPALKKGMIVLCDRFLDSTIAYQGYGNGVDLKMIEMVGGYATQGLMPNLTVVFDIDAKIGLSRITGDKDRIEQRSINYHNKVRQGFVALAKAQPKRVHLIKANKGKEEIHEQVRAAVDILLEQV